MRVVLDTNVLISALVFPDSKPDKILAQARRHDIELFISLFILSELERVLREKFHFTKKESSAVVTAVRAFAHVITPLERIAVVTAKDDDNRILECAIAAQAAFLVTGDKRHLLPLRTYRGIKIVTPAEFLELYDT